MNGLNTNSVAHFLFISYNLEIVEIGIFLNTYSAIFGELFQTQLSLCKIIGAIYIREGNICLNVLDH